MPDRPAPYQGCGDRTDHWIGNPVSAPVLCWVTTPAAISIMYVLGCDEVQRREVGDQVAGVVQVEVLQRFAPAQPHGPDPVSPAGKSPLRDFALQAGDDKLLMRPRPRRPPGPRATLYIDMP